MSAPIVQSDYEALDALVRRFQEQNQQTIALKQRVDRSVTALRSGGWQGEGSTAFLQEMERIVNPATQRLIDALAEAQRVTLQVKMLMHQAEEEAASVFQGEGIGGTGLGTASQGDPINPSTDLTSPTGYKMPTDPNTITREQWNNLSEEERRFLHYNRNIYQADLPQTRTDLKEGEWTNHGEAVAHNLNGTSGNIDMRGTGPRAHQQAIYDTNDNLVNDPANQGTYDFVPPPDLGPLKAKIAELKASIGDWDKMVELTKDNLGLSAEAFEQFKGHWEVDVMPWIEHGNSPDDPTTREDRIAALLSSRDGNAGALVFSPKLLVEGAGIAIDSAVDAVRDIF